MPDRFTGALETPLAVFDATRMPAESLGDSSAAPLETPLVGFDAARMPAPSVPADRENKK
jgi:hypothetical protein